MFNTFIEPQSSIADLRPGQPQGQIFAGLNMQFKHCMAQQMLTACPAVNQQTELDPDLVTFCRPVPVLLADTADNHRTTILRGGTGTMFSARVCFVISIIWIVVLLSVDLLYAAAPVAQQSPPASKPPIPILDKEQAESLEKESAQGENIPFLGQAGEKNLDLLQQKGSAMIIRAADWLDSFFYDPRYIAEENTTRARLKLAFGYSRYDHYEFQPGIDIRLSLPQLQHRALIFVNAHDDTDFDVDSTPDTSREKDSSEKLTVGVKYFFALGERYNIYTDVGLSLGYAYAGLRYRHEHGLFDNTWVGRFTNRLRYYTDDGWEDKASYDLERHLGERFFFRSTVTGTLAESRDGIPFSADCRLYQVLNIDRALLYETAAYMDTEPELSLTDFQVRLRYRERFFRDWLVLEVAPQMSFPADYDHQFNPGLVFKFELDFGYLQDHKAYESVFRF